MAASFVRSAVALALVSLAALPAYAGGPDPRCEAAKLAAAGRYAQCRFASQATAVKKGGAPDFGKCDAALAKAWANTEASVSTFCATFGDVDEVAESLNWRVGGVMLWLSGTLPLWASRTLSTGQTFPSAADKNDGVLGAVAVPDDGTLGGGLRRGYRDNGDGTITEVSTGLMWEKKGLVEGLHHVDDVYRWSGNGAQETIWDWIQDVNDESGNGFAGYDDWRIPNARELANLTDYLGLSPTIHVIFDLNCDDDCAGPDCTCTAPDVYWSSTTARLPSEAVAVSFEEGQVGPLLKDSPAHVRAVRGGL